MTDPHEIPYDFHGSPAAAPSPAVALLWGQEPGPAMHCAASGVLRGKRWRVALRLCLDSMVAG